MVRQWIANSLSPVRIWVPPYKFLTIVLTFNLDTSTVYYKIIWECGEIGRHDGLKTRCLAIGVRVQVPPFPTRNLKEFAIETKLVFLLAFNLFYYI